MKLTDIHGMDILWEGLVDDQSCVVYANLTEANTARVGFGQNTKGGMIRGIAGNIITNPVLAGLAAGFAVDAVKKYMNNKSKTTQFFAKDHREREMYRKVVDDLMKTGKYRKTKDKYVPGGYLWELRLI